MVKRGDIFSYKKIILPQSQRLSNKSSGMAKFFSHAVLVSPDTHIKIHSISHDQYSRYLLLNCTLNERKYVLINVYAPTVDKTTEQSNYGHLPCNNMEKYFGRCIIIGGDLYFNLANIEAVQNNQNHSYRSYLIQLFKIYGLVDIWNIKILVLKNSLIGKTPTTDLFT